MDIVNIIFAKLYPNGTIYVILLLRKCKKGSLLMNFGERLRQLRKDKNLTQDQLAKELGISRSALVHYERNEREPGFEAIKKLEDYFGISTIDLSEEFDYYGISSKRINTSQDASQKEQYLFGELIRQRRNERNLPLNDFAKLMDKPIETIIEWEENDIPTGKIDYQTANRLALILQTPLYWLMGVSNKLFFVPPLPEADYFGHELLPSNLVIESKEISDEEIELIKIILKAMSGLNPNQRKKRVEAVKTTLKMVEEIQKTD